MPRVFISYSHDSSAHKDAVLLLAQSLRALGVDARVDELFIHEANELWRWMLAERDAADFVVVVCSPGYFAKSGPQASQEIGAGVGWEAGAMMRELYSKPESARRKYIPVLLDDTPAETVTEILRSSLWYQVELSAVGNGKLRRIRQLLEALLAGAATDQPDLTVEVQRALLVVPGLESLFRKLIGRQAVSAVPVLPPPVLSTSALHDSAEEALADKRRPIPAEGSLDTAALPVSQQLPPTTQRVASRAVVEDFGVQEILLGRGPRLHGEYRRRLEAATSSVDLLGMGERYALSAFGDSVKEVAERGVVIRILLLDPEFPGHGFSVADLRDTEEGDEVGALRQDVERFREYVRSVADLPIEVRCYRALPTLSITRVDDDLFWGPYLFGERSRDSPTVLVRRGGLLFDQMQRHFDVLWGRSALLSTSSRTTD